MYIDLLYQVIMYVKFYVAGAEAFCMFSFAIVNIVRRRISKVFAPVESLRNNTLIVALLLRVLVVNTMSFRYFPLSSPSIFP